MALEALGYVRMRKADLLMILGRAERQREMLAAAAKKAASPATVLNPSATGSSTWLLPMRSLGRDTSLPEALTLAYAMRSDDLVGADLTLTVPVVQYRCANTGRLRGSMGSKQGQGAMFSAIAREDTSGLASTHSNNLSPVTWSLFQARGRQEC